VPVILAGDYNVMPTDLDVYKPERWIENALFKPEVKKALKKLTAQGWRDAIRVLYPDERIYTFGITCIMLMNATPVYVLIISC
jgi:exodeoxyribonuclease-3